MKPMPQRLFILAILPIFLALSVLVLWSPAIAGEINNIQIAQSNFQKLNGTWMTEKQLPDSDNAQECLWDWKIDKAVISGEKMSLFLTGKNKQQVVSGKINTEKWILKLTENYRSNLPPALPKLMLILPVTLKGIGLVDGI